MKCTKINIFLLLFYAFQRKNSTLCIIPQNTLDLLSELGMIVSQALLCVNFIIADQQKFTFYLK